MAAFARAWYNVHRASPLARALERSAKRALSTARPSTDHDATTAGRGSARRRAARLALASLVAALHGAACGGPREGIELLGRPESFVDGRVGTRERDWVEKQLGRQIRISDVVLRTLPAGPPSLLRFRLDVPAGARLSFSYGVAPDSWERPGVEFVVKVLHGGREDTVFTKLVDTLNQPAQRRWLRGEADLGRHAGRDVELVFETRGFEDSPDPRRALWGAPALTSARDDAPIVVVYLVDTLRADHTTPYGYQRDTTPELAKFAGDAVLFEQAIAASSWTKPSVASLFTSLLPSRHLAVQLRDPLDLGHVTLAEMLQAKGFSTGAAIANSVVYSEGSHFEQGFDSFVGLHDDSGRASKEVAADKVVDAALEFLDSRRGRPAFLYVHTMDPHVPYAPPAPYDRMFEPHPAPGHPGVDPRTDYSEPLDRERLLAQYDGDVAYGDREFGRFVRELRARGLYERALFVFLADHGEEFLDHGKWLHGRSVFDELVRVPLLVKFPGGREAGRRVGQQVQLVDLLPTVLHELGLPVPQPPVVAGRPLQAVLRGDAPEPPAVSEISHRGFVASGMRTSRDKFVMRFSPEEGDLYFDLKADPREQADLAPRGGERARLLRAGVEASMVSDPFRRHMKLAGAGDYVLELRSPGWLEGVEPIGFGAGESYAVEQGGRRLRLRVRPRAGAPREVALSVRPLGAPIWLEGTRDGRPLRPSDVAIAEEGTRPASFPLKLPEIESEHERFQNVLAPPRLDPPGLQLWLTPKPGRRVMEMDAAACERLKALGYVATCG